MTIQDIIRILLRRWRLVASITLAGGLLGYMYESSQPEVFVAEGRVLISPSLTDEGADLVEITGSLARGTMQRTLAEVVTGSAARAAAGNAVPGTDRYSVTSLVIPEANVVRVTVRGPNAARAEELGSAVIEEAKAFFEVRYPIYEVALISAPDSPGSPASPNPQLGALVGLVLGGIVVTIGLLFAEDAAAVPPHGRVAGDDPQDTASVEPQRRSEPWGISVLQAKMRASEAMSAPVGPPEPDPVVTSRPSADVVFEALRQAAGTTESDDLRAPAGHSATTIESEKSAGAESQGQLGNRPR